MKASLITLVALASYALALPQDRGGSGALAEDIGAPSISLASHSVEDPEGEIRLSFYIWTGTLSHSTGHCYLQGTGKKSIESTQAKCKDWDNKPMLYSISIRNYKDSGNFDAVITYTGKRASGAKKITSLPVKLRENTSWTCVGSQFGHKQLCMNAPRAGSNDQNGKSVFGDMDPLPVVFAGSV